MTVDRLLADLDAALRGGPPMIVGEPPEREVPMDAALVIRTSGSVSGRGRPVPLTTAEVTASVRATEARLAGPGQWLLALPAGHIAGLQVLGRSILAGTTPVQLGSEETIADAVARLRTDVPRYASIVPTQLIRALSPAGRSDLEALAALDAVLVGGSAVDPAAVAMARERGVHVVTTYGMTETAGGCVYDGVPLDGVEVRLEGGAVQLSGPMVTSGYLDDGPQPFTLTAGRRWFRTSDLGRCSDGRLEVLGRIDDVLISGGVNVHPAAVERVIGEVDGVAGVCVVGRASREWGTEIVAVVVPAADARTPAGLLDTIRARVKSAVGAAAAPRVLFLRESLPLRGPGKVDRLAVAAWAADARPDASRGSRPPADVGGPGPATCSPNHPVTPHRGCGWPGPRHR
ncbi:AMP-binding protein [Pseudactinotalea sp. HY160]|uniref:AMP-binding protein n=1 Tax=Pseudactinotalea sp. HY160 TaxID=2654490 RepID=UPI00351BA4FE